MEERGKGDILLFRDVHRTVHVWEGFRRELLILLQQAIQPLLDNLFRLGNHALDDFTGEFDRINQSGVLTEEIKTVCLILTSLA